MRVLTLFTKCGAGFNSISGNHSDSLFQPYDFVISLGTSSSAPLRHEVEIPDPSLIWTLCQLPSVAAPTDRCPAGRPFGIQVVSRKYDDYRLLQAVETMIDDVGGAVNWIQ